MLTSVHIIHILLINLFFIIEKNNSKFANYYSVLTKMNKLQELLKKRNISNNQLCKLIRETDNSFARRTLTRFHHEQDTRLSTIIKICMALNVTPNDIIDYEKYI
jgi:DNA-binding Xre family transcriptional regulator